MDEPFGAVDAIVRTALQNAIVSIARTLGTTVFFVTHDVEEALRIADRIVVMSRGRIEQAATPFALLAHPATEYVAGLLGGDGVMRRLGLLPITSALQPSSRALASRPQLPDSATLREAMSTFAAGAETIDVARDGQHLGSLTFADLRLALAAASR